MSRVVVGRRVAMSLISLLLNLLWIVCGGLWMALGWVIAAVVMAITIIGLPWARAAFSIAAYTLLPFGYKAVPRDEYFGREDVGTGPLGVIGNVVWLLARPWRSRTPACSQPRSPATPTISIKHCSPMSGYGCRVRGQRCWDRASEPVKIISPRVGRGSNAT